MNRLTRMPAAWRRLTVGCSCLDCATASRPAFGGDFLPVFRDEADILGQNLQRDFENLERVAHFEVQLGVEALRAGGSRRDPACGGGRRADAR